MRIFFYFLVSTIFCISCQDEKPVTVSNPDTLFLDLPSELTSVDFINAVEHTDELNIFNYRNFYNGGGVAIGDINNDGLSDLFFTANMGANKLYINKGDFVFEDISKSAGIELIDKWSTGVTMIDIDADGWLDIYVCNAGYRKGADQKNALFINQGNNTFVEQAALYVLDYNDYSTHASFFDYDRDGDLDVYLLNNSFIPVNTLNYSNKRDLRAEDWPVADFLKGGGDKLLRNDDGIFKDVSAEAGILGSLIGFGLGITVGDINDDQLLDIYVSNDFFERDYLYINQGDGTFQEDLLDRIAHLSHSSMGADMADINNDGMPEIFVTDMLPDDDYRLKTNTTFDNVNLRNLKEKNGFYNQYMHNTLQLNSGSGDFQEISFYADVAASDWSWGALVFDADNDGYSDIFVCNGILNDVIDQDFIDFFANNIIQEMVLSGNKQKIDSIIARMPSQALVNKFFKNQGGLKFLDASISSGITKETFSNGAAYGDLDNDGDLDLVVSNVNQKAQVYRNNASNNFIGCKLSYEDANPFGIGSKIKVYSDDKILVKELVPARGFQSSVDYKITIGLGDSLSVDSLFIIWPKGEMQKIENQTLGTYNSIVFERQKVIEHNTGVSQKGIFTSQTKHNFPSHKEDDFNDFYYERNIPTQLSKEGPSLAQGDFDGDGLEDLYFGGAAGQTPVLLKQTKSGYVSHQPEYFEKFKAFEDTYAVFFDCDGDKDLDLLVASGGNNVTYNKRAFRDRLYVNKNGIFEIDYNAIPPISLNTAVLQPIDIDQDGDLDLFAGMRSVPGEYGISPGSYIYMNLGNGMFTDVTEQVIPELALAGNITDAIVADVLPSRGDEIILVGEWMAPKILFYDGKNLKISESELSNYSGWWQTVVASDIDQDGDQDLLLGNVGENFYLEATSDKPLYLWINDFDDNGSVEKIITARNDKGDFPVFVKRDMVDLLPGLKKENLMHSAYAKKSIADLFPTEKVSTSIVKQVNYLSSAMAINDGKGNFRIKALDPLVQLSCLNAILEWDVNKDGFPDFVIGGNNTYLLPQFSSLDACSGKILLNDQKGNFDLVSGDEAGLDVKGVVREIRKLRTMSTEQLIFLINDNAPKVYQLTD